MKTATDFLEQLAQNLDQRVFRTVDKVYCEASVVQEFADQQNLEMKKQNTELIEILKQSVSVIQQWHGDECFHIYFNNAPEMKLIKSILSNDNQKT